MPNTHSTLTSLFTDIADAIRAKTGDANQIVADSFPTAISQIPTGVTPSGTLSISSNGNFDVTSYASAAVDVPVSAIIAKDSASFVVLPSDGSTLELDTLSATANGTYNPSSGHAFGTVEVSVPGSPSGTTSISANGTYNIAAFAEADVLVPNSYTASDEGKVVQSGALVSQGSSTFTANDTYDTTYLDSITVAVSGTPQGTITLSANGTYNVYDYASAEVNVPTTGLGNPTVRKDVNLYDYDGVILYAYTAAEFLALTEYPMTPAHTGLKSATWNWTLSDAKTFVTAHGSLDIGLTYSTDNGRSKIYITLDSSHLTQRFGFDRHQQGPYTIYWGDGTSDTLSSGTGTIQTSHTYAAAGDYVIELESNGSSYLFGNTTTLTTMSAITKVELSDDVDALGNNAFDGATNLETIMMGRGNVAVGGYVFRNNHNLRFLVLSQLGGCLGWVSNYTNCYKLQQIVANNSTVQTGPADFSKCYSLLRCYVLNAGTYDFTGCYSLQEIVFKEDFSQSLNTSACYAAVLYDFRGATAVPSSTITLNVGRADCHIVVPDSLYSSWVSASNWSTYSSKIISASDYAAL